MTTTNPSDATPILEGIRRWVEIETPTEAPEQVNKLADLVADGYRGLPATVERIAGHSGCGDHLVVRSSWGQDEPGILVLSHLDTVHPLGFIERLPFRISGDSAFGPGIYDMKGGAYLAYHAFRQACADGARPSLGITQLYVSDEEIGSPTSRAGSVTSTYFASAANCRINATLVGLPTSSSEVKRCVIGSAVLRPSPAISRSAAKAR